MALKGELFNTDMVRALLDGRKLHTARPVKKKYDNTHFEYRTDKYGTEFVEMQNDIEGETFGKNSDGTTWRKLRGYIVPKPKFQPGDYMYVRETWYKDTGRYMYKADYCTSEKFYRNGQEITIKWSPSIHMPREAARMFYKVTKVEVVHLDDVDEQFAREDGFEADPICREISADEMNSALDKFKRFWVDTYGADARWMWVYWMERVTKEEAWNAIM